MFGFHSAADRRRGKTFLLITAVLHGLFPIFLHAGVSIFPPAFFAGSSLLVASAFPFLWLLARGENAFAMNARIFGQLLFVCCFNLILPTLFIAIGTQWTSGINTTLLLQAEMLFTFLIVNVLFREHLGKRRMIGASIVFLGTVVVLFHGNLHLNVGELLIVLGTMFYPFGNLISKKLVKAVPTMEILALRSSISGAALLLLSLFLGEDAASALDRSMTAAGGLILLQGFFVLFVSKVLWYEGLRWISVGRSVFIVSSAPAFGVLFAVLLLHEMPTIQQLMGLSLTLLGVFFLTSHKAPFGPAPV